MMVIMVKERSWRDMLSRGHAEVGMAGESSVSFVVVTLAD